MQAEILALRHQVLVLQRRTRGRRLRLKSFDRLFWVCLSRLWRDWRKSLRIIKPETVIAWNRKAFRLYWTWKSRSQQGRPAISSEIRALIRHMSLANPRWGAPRIHGELQKLGIEISETSVAKYMVHPRRPASQSWKTFLKNHMRDLVATDFFVVPTASLRVLFVFLVLSHERRRVVHFAVTAHPTAGWTTQQLIDAFPWDAPPQYLLRDRDGSYGEPFPQTAEAMNIQQVLTAPRSPWQNAYVERLIGSIRRECLDHVLIFTERGLRRMLQLYFATTNDLVRTYLFKKMLRFRVLFSQHGWEE